MLTDTEKQGYIARRDEIYDHIALLELTVKDLILESQRACLHHGGHEWGKPMGVFGRYCIHCRVQDCVSADYTIRRAEHPQSRVVNVLPRGDGWKP